MTSLANAKSAVKGKRVLLVDDSSTALLLSRMTLASGGYEIIVARDGSEAVERAVAEHPDVILMDVVMPKMNGIDACRVLRTLPETRDTPIIMVTTRGAAENVEAGYEAGCNEYVTKPIDPVELAVKLRNYIGD